MADDRSDPALSDVVDDVDDLVEPEPLTIEEIDAVQPINTDAANADAFEKRYGSAFRFVTNWKTWIAWDGKRWALEGAEAMAFAAAIRSARTSFAECKLRLIALDQEHKAALTKFGGKCQATEKIEERIKFEQKVLGWYLTSQSTSKANACAQAALTRLLTPMSALDRDPMLFNVANGTIDLRTGELRPHDREDLITQLSDIEYNPGHAACPTWERFINEAMQGDLELVLYLQRVVGYCLTASIDEHAVFFLHGLGGNGKSTFARTVSALMGDYACAAPRDLLFEQKGQKPHPTELARLYRRRFVTCSEIGERAVIDEAKLKDLTGGDVVAVRRMAEDFWDLHPTHKLLLAGNHKPTIHGDDEGIWRRFRLVLWLYTVQQPDRALPKKLLGELPGILRWAVNGCLEWQRLGLAEPARVTAATQAYRVESDVIGEFLKSCEVHPDARCSMQDLRRHYEKWCEDIGAMPLGAHMFGKRLRHHGIESGTVRLGLDGYAKGWKGVAIPRAQ